MRKILLLGVLSAAMTAGASLASAHDFRHIFHRGHHAHHSHHATSHVYGTYTRHIRVKRTYYTTIPVRYNLIAKQVLVRPARRIAHRTPAITRRVAETVMIRPARRIWTYYTDHHGRKIGYWRDKPAQYATRYRTVLVRAASVSYSIIPAQYRTIRKRVRVH